MFHIDIVFIFWLYTTGKLFLLQGPDLVEGSFIFLQEEDSEMFTEFRDCMHTEWRNNRDGDM